MNSIIKNQLSQLGILQHLNAFRMHYETRRWIAKGYRGTPPLSVKRKILMAYLQNYRLTQFIETGTHLGDTLAYIAHDKSIHCTSIELAEVYYKQAKHRFRSYTNIDLIHGDSGALMASVINKLDSPALFWLDGHYSGGLTAQGTIDTPICAELEAILMSRHKDHVILIDDVRCFDGTNNYPHLDDLLKVVRDKSDYCAEVSADIIRLTPR